MSLITGDVRDLGGQAMSEYDAQLTFNLSTMNDAGYVTNPNRPVRTGPGSNGKFSIDLNPTVEALSEAWYHVRIDWFDTNGTLVTDLEFQIQVPSIGGELSSLAELYVASAGRTNPFIWWTSLIEPPSRNYLWLHANPGNANDPVSTKEVRQWR